MIKFALIISITFFLALTGVAVSLSKASAPQVKQNEDAVDKALQNLAYESCMVGVDFSAKQVKMTFDQRDKADQDCLKYSRK